MTGWQRTIIPATARVVDAIGAIDATPFRIALVTDETGRLIGTITDGDVRRGILRGVSSEGPVDQIMNRSPLTLKPGDDRSAAIERVRKALLRQLPILDAAGRVVDVWTQDSPTAPAKKHPNWVVVMAGGLGTRLRPLTDDAPKPMLEVGGRPILETIIDSFCKQNFRRFFLAVNYKADIVENYFGDGGKWNAEIHYLREKERLGTAGALGLIDRELNEPIIVTNGDLLTNVDFESLLEYHRRHGARATMAVREYDFQVPFGVVRLDQHSIVSIDEKPVQTLFVNAGIYVIDPAEIADLRPARPLDMPNLMERIIADGGEVAAFPIREFWLDIGRLDDFETANGKYEELFK